MSSFTRKSGVLLHISSLTGPYGIGEIGPHAFTFIDQLCDMGQHLWQILPLGDTGEGHSPYATISAFANNPILISFDKLCEDGLLTIDEIGEFPTRDMNKIDFDLIVPLRTKILHHVSENFHSRASSYQIKQFDDYCKTHESWLDDYALFVSIKNNQNGKKWHEWDDHYLIRDKQALERAKKIFKEEIKEIKILQYLFHAQWQNLKTYAHSKGVQIIGDVPIYVSFDSVDVWVNRTLFKLDSSGCMLSQSGCPPDYFQKSGQLWGNPLYNWDAHEHEKFAWWINRIKTLFEMVDMVRIDHFNGLVKYWEVPIKNKTAKAGNWVRGPEQKLLDAIFTRLGAKPIIAEDLGEASVDAKPLRKKYDIPGMEILQFSFNEAMENQNLKAGLEFPKNSVIYTGTHDNDTLLGWLENLNPSLIDQLEDSLSKNGVNGKDSTLNWKLISFAFESKANTAIVPLQDILGLDNSARMNVPGTINGNWNWRFAQGVIPESTVKMMKELTQNTDRF